jgi:putative transposase
VSYSTHHFIVERPGAVCYDPTVPHDRRLHRGVGTYFLTVVTHRRRRFLCSALARRCLHEAIDRVRAQWPFVIEERVLLPDHFHIIPTLPDGQSGFSVRIGRVKRSFTRAYLAAGGKELAQSESRAEHGLRGVC